MTVALLINDLGPPHQTWAILARNLLAELRRQGVRAVVIRARGDKALPFRSFQNGTAYYSVGRLGLPFHGALAALQLAWIFRREGVSVAHVHGIGRDHWGLRLFGRLSRTPLLFTFHGGAGSGAPGPARARRELRFFLERAARVTAVSRASARHLEERSPLPVRAVRVVPNGLPQAEQEPEAAFGLPDPYILSVGTICLHKGTDVLLLALHDLLRRARPIPHAVLCGEDMTRGALFSDLARRLGLEGHATLLGPRPNGTVRRLLADCLFFVSPSRGESFGLAILEAMASGKAVVAPAAGGVPELVEDGVSGLLYAPGDASSLADAIERLAGDAGLRARLGMQAAQAAAGYTWERAVRAYRGLYQEALEAA